MANGRDEKIESDIKPFFRWTRSYLINQQQFFSLYELMDKFILLKEICSKMEFLF